MEEEKSLCCGIMAGLRFLSEQYGHFRVNMDMVYINNVNKKQKSGERPSVKVWMNSDLKQPRPEFPCS